MSDNRTVTVLGDEAQADNEMQTRRDYIYVDQVERAPHPALSSGTIRAWGVVAGLFWLVLFVVAWLLRVALCWNNSSWLGPSGECRAAMGFAWLVAGAPLLLALAVAVVQLRRQFLLTTAEAARGSIVRDRYSNPISAARVHARTMQDDAAYFVSAQAAEIAMAPYKQWLGLDSMSLGSGAPGKAVAEAAVADQPAPLISADVWLPWLDEKPHLLLAAETGGGKSVTASVVVARRVQQRGDAVAILDPHWSPLVEADEGTLVPKWGGIEPAARSHIEIRQALRTLRREYNQRMEQLRTGDIIEGHFPPLTVVIDEVPEVVAEIKKLDRRGEDTWADTTEVLGSGARKVNISIILLTQSPLVEDIKLNSAMRKNFARVALQHAEVVALVREATDAATKAAVLAAVKGQRYPSALVRDGDAYALDRSDMLARMPRTITATSWTLEPTTQQPDPIPTMELLRRARKAG